MKHASTTIMVAFFCLTFCSGQTPDNSDLNALSFEIGKTGAIYNLNYDHKIWGKNFGFRFGAGSNIARYIRAATFGGGGYTLIGKTRCFFELGLDLQYLIVDRVSDDQKGATFIYPDYSTKTHYPSLNCGYRAYGKNTLFRIGLSPGQIETKIIPGGYISYGVSF